jgi:hypothetical protein
MESSQFRELKRSSALFLMLAGLVPKAQAVRDACVASAAVQRDPRTTQVQHRKAFTPRAAVLTLSPNKKLGGSTS